MHGLLPSPVAALRDRLRSIAAAVGDTRTRVIDARAALSTQIAAVHADVLHNGAGGATWQAQAAALEQRLAELEAGLAAGAADSARLRDILRAVCDREPQQRERLRELRRSDAYQAAFDDDEPLVSVVIPTFDNHRLLRERAIPSILAQTYQHFEVVVVGDAAPDEARAAVESFGDPRLRYSNLCYRGPYPDDPRERWYVAGVPPYNEAVRLARGRWIAPLDDDDAWRPDHLASVLEAARRERLELAYGTILKRRPDGGSVLLGSFPPVLGQFTLQSAIYHAGVAEIFELELSDTLFELPYDWALCRRMMRAGVRMGMVDAISVDYYPSDLWSSRNGHGAAPELAAGSEAEWEYVPEGWARAEDETQPCARGWDVEDVASAYATHWPAYCRALADARPLGVTHELRPGDEMSNGSVVSHNAALTLAFVLARTGRDAGPVSVLDWGGGVGHQHAIARSALPEIEFDWHTRELPAVCREGRRVSPSITFHEDDTTLARSYDLVLASGSLQYVRAWRERLVSLTRASRGGLLLTRVPLVDLEPSFVVLQRARAYGYATEYLGWAFNRSELLEAVADAGMRLEREFVLIEPQPIPGAPEPVRYGAFHFERAS